MQTIRKHSICLLLLLVAYGVNAQEFSIQLKGNVYSNVGDVAATHISNISSKRGTIADAKGFFSISVKLNDTLVFSAVQFKNKLVKVSKEILQKKYLLVVLEESLTELDEVVVTPYNLSGDLKRDMGTMKIEPIITASTLGLPNAYVKVKTQSERRLFEADAGKFIEIGFDSTSFDPVFYVNLNKILNRITGRTKILKKYVAEDKKIALLNKVKRMYPDSVYVQDLKIPKDNINDFMNFCEVDTAFVSVVETNDVLKIWELLQSNSLLYRKNNKLNHP